MLSQLRVAAIAAMLRDGLSQRSVARRTGAARGTVATIAAGKHPWQTGVAEDRLEARGVRLEAEKPRPTGRCGGCGRKIELPCRACEAEKQGLGARGGGRAEEAPDPRPSTLDPQGPGPRPIADVLRELADEVEPLGIELSGKRRERYERVRAVKARAEQVFRRKCEQGRGAGGEGRGEADETIETACGRCQRPLSVEFARVDGAELVTIVADGHAVMECPNCRRTFPPLRAGEAKDLLSL